jgi:hypothetical protein
MAYQTIPPSSSGGDTTTIATELSTLLGLTGIDAEDAAIDSSDFVEDVVTQPLVWTASGTPVQGTATKGGTWSANVAGASSINRPAAWASLARATNALGLCWRGKFDASAVAAGCLMRGALIDVATSQGFYVGFYGTTFTGDGTKFIAATYDGVTARYYASTIAIDSSYHVFRLWSANGTAFFFSVDSETPVAMNAGDLPASSVYMKPYFDASTAENQTFDYFIAVTARE